MRQTLLEGCFYLLLASATLALVAIAGEAGPRFLDRARLRDMLTLDEREPLAEAEAALAAAEADLASARADRAASGEAAVAAKQAVALERRAALERILEEIATTEARVAQLSDRQVRALNAAFHRAERRKLLPFDIDADLLGRMVEEHWEAQEIQLQISGFADEEAQRRNAGSAASG